MNKSRFIADFIPVSSETDALDQLQSIRKKYYDARHHCYAYVIGSQSELYKCSDDGEPSGTAGLPILNVLRGNGFSDVLCVVTRYFGGVLLGTGGLTRAYSDAALSALRSSSPVRMEKNAVCSLVCGYSDWSKIQKIFQQFGAKVLSSEFSENIQVRFSVLVSEADALFHQINDKTLGKVTAYTEYESYMPVGVHE